jgi:phage terminase large subunit
VSKLGPIITKQKRIKILVGGRGSTKSTFAADYVAARMSQGALACCTREFQNSIDESVHRLMLDEIERLGLEGFSHTNSGINHTSGGRNFYKGLARNIASIKSMLSGVDILWIEEGETLSENTLRVLTASLRLSAKDAEKLIAGEDIQMPEMLITMNRGSSADAISKKLLERAEPELERCGYYEDDIMMVIEVNYTDMPKEWFEASGLEVERKDDYENLPRAMYDHKWLGKYLDTVDNAIILPEWFDASLDAHKKKPEAFKQLGAVVAAHDPFDDGADAGGFAVRHGSVITQVRSKATGEIDETCDWATGLAIEAGADCFVWDGDGMGTGLKRQVSDAFSGKAADYQMFRGSLRGSAQDNAEQMYMPTGGDEKAQKKYKDTFFNNRAQYYWLLAQRFKNTYKCIEKGEYIDPDDMISLNVDCIDDIQGLRSQLCRIPRKPNPNGLIQIMSKEEMKKLGIRSPNEADSIMMALYAPEVAEVVELNFAGW